MKTFLQFLSESEASGNYVSIGLKSPLIVPKLEPMFGGSFVCDPKDQHVTLIYSKSTDVSKSRVLSALHHWDTVEAEIGDVAAFDAVPKNGERAKDETTIVVKIKSKVLDEIHERLKSDLGLKHSYEDYSPHISLLYNLPISEKQRALDYISKWLKSSGPKTIELYGWVSDNIKENWHSKK